MSKHTPGPWTSREAYDNGEPCGMVIGPMGYDIATSNEDENRANARLIAAAPEMLAALSAIVEAGRMSSSQRAVYCADIARSAIARIDIGD